MVHHRRSFVSGAFVAVLLLTAVAAGTFAQGDAPGAPAGPAEAAAPAGDGPPFPLHTIEGTGGLVLTPTALLVNPGPEGTVVGMPSVSTQLVGIGSKDLEIVAFTWTFFQRLELGYAWNRLGLDDFEDSVQAAIPGADIGTGDIQLHNFNARLNVIREGEWDMAWMPAVTVGAHYKYNADIDNMDRKLGGALTALAGLDDNDSVDFTLTTTKTVTLAGRPTFVSLGARYTEASQFGLAGFTDDYDLVFEGGIVMLVLDNLAVGAEYRQQPDGVALGDVIHEQDDWWDVHAAYIINENAVVYAVVGSAGDVLDEEDEVFYGAVLKWEF